jgi:hypothetical protein
VIKTKKSRFFGKFEDIVLLLVCANDSKKGLKEGVE